MERLDKWIASEGGLTRSEARRCIRGGCVSVNGQLQRDAGLAVDPAEDTVCLDGKVIAYRQQVYFMLHKPAGLLTATSDKTRETVVDLAFSLTGRKGLFPVGRLDKDTTGLLLITDDGAFAHRVIAPKYGIEKEYYVNLDGPVKPEFAAQFAAGVILADGARCAPSRLILIPDRPCDARLILTEGKYHEVKRMFGTVGLGVNRLQRLRIGSLSLDPALCPGELRPLTEQELIACQTNSAV